MRVAALSAWTVAVLTVALVASPPPSEAAVYWAGPNGIGRANLDGEAVAPGFVGALASAPCGVAVDHGHVYWGDPAGNAIGRADITGADVDPAFITGADSPCAVAVDRGHLYWGNTGALLDGQTIGRASVDGSGVDQSFVTGAAGPCGLAVDDDHLYWTNASDGTIGRAELDGGGVQQSFITGASRPCGLAVTGGEIVPDRHNIVGGHVYWANTGGPFSAGTTIGRASLEGAAVEPSFIHGLHGVWGLALGADHVVWGSAEAGSVGRAFVDGTEVEEGFIPGTGPTFGLAIDGTAVRIAVGAPVKRTRRGIARLPVSVPGPGEVALEATRRVRADAAHADGPGEVTLTVRARGRSLRRLAATGGVRVNARIAFTPAGASAVTQSAAVRLIRR
jgi:hypothetical protein